MADRVDGLALGMLSAGGLFVYAGIKGYSVPHALQALITGQPPSTGGVANPITAPSFATTGVGPGAASPSAGGSAGTTPASGSETSFYSAMLKDLGAPATAANLMSCYAWGRHEEPGFPPQSVGGFAWNPLNIKDSSGGFAQYPSATAGAAATAQFLLANSHYTNIVAAFRSGKGLCGNPSVASDLSWWSGGGGAVPPSQGYSSVC